MNKPKKIKLYSNYTKSDCPDIFNNFKVSDSAKLIKTSGDKIWVTITKVLGDGRYHGTPNDKDVVIFEGNNIFDYTEGK